MSSFCEFAFLFQRQSNNQIKTLFIKSSNESAYSDFDLIILNSFPPGEIGGDIHYSFTASLNLCYSWVFLYDGTPYSIVLVSSKLFPFLFFDFLHKFRDYCIHENTFLTPQEKFFALWDLLQQWKIDELCHFHLVYPTETNTVAVNTKLMCFENFSPSKLIPPDISLVQLWHNLLTRSRIRITADSPEVLSAAVFATISLTSPFPYRDSILLTVSPSDPRLKSEVAENYDIIATLKGIDTTSPLQYNTVFHAVPLIDNENTALQRSMLYQRCHRLQSLIINMMDRTLFTNPYSDILNSPFVTDDIEELLEITSSILSPNDFRDFEATYTLKRWRKSVTYRDSFRSAFLSFSPQNVLIKMSRQHLIVIREKLKQMSSIFHNDQHLYSVIKLYRYHVKKLLKNVNSSEVSYSVSETYLKGLDGGEAGSGRVDASKLSLMCLNSSQTSVPFQSVSDSDNGESSSEVQQLI